MPIIGNVLEILDSAIWDRVPVTDSLHTDFFNEALFSRPEKDQFTTNCYKAGVLDPPQRFTIRAVRLSFLRDGEPLPLNHPLWWNSLLSLYIGNKAWVHDPSHMLVDPMWLAAASVSAWKDLSAQERMTILERGSDVLYDTIRIEEREPFHGRLELNGIARRHVPENCEAFLVLDGSRERGVS
jgi:hypothetical protein